MKKFRNYLNGHQWTASLSGKISRDINPADRDEVICEVQSSVIADVELAMAAASTAFSGWRKMPVPRRAALLARVLAEMQKRKEEFVRTITLENGKTLRKSHAEFTAAVKEADFKSVRAGGSEARAFLRNNQTQFVILSASPWVW